MVSAGTKKKTLVRHAERVLIVGKCKEIKGFKVLVLKDTVVTATRHITNIETIDGATNNQIQRALQNYRGQAPKHVHKTVSCEHPVTEASDTQPKELIPLGQVDHSAKWKKSKKQAEADAHREGRSMKT